MPAYAQVAGDPDAGPRRTALPECQQSGALMRDPSWPLTPQADIWEAACRRAGKS
jgi:hypothetical protein